MMIKVAKIKSVGGYRLRATFSDGMAGEFDFSDHRRRRRPYGRTLRDRYFARVFLEDGAPTWPNGFDAARLAAPGNRGGRRAFARCSGLRARQSKAADPARRFVCGKPRAIQTQAPFRCADVQIVSRNLAVIRHSLRRREETSNRPFSTAIRHHRFRRASLPESKTRYHRTRDQRRRDLAAASPVHRARTSPRPLYVAAAVDGGALRIPPLRHQAGLGLPVRRYRGRADDRHLALLSARGPCCRATIFCFYAWSPFRSRCSRAVWRHRTRRK